MVKSILDTCCCSEVDRMGDLLPNSACREKYCNSKRLTTQNCCHRKFQLMATSGRSSMYLQQHCLERCQGFCENEDFCRNPRRFYLPPSLPLLGERYSCTARSVGGFGEAAVWVCRRQEVSRGARGPRSAASPWAPAGRAPPMAPLRRRPRAPPSAPYWWRGGRG